MLNEIIQYEPTELFSHELLGRLATLGIEKGKPFKPDARMQEIFDQAAKQGVAMSRAIVYASRDPEINYWPNRHWEKMFIRNTEFYERRSQRYRRSDPLALPGHLRYPPTCSPPRRAWAQPT